MTLPNSRNTNYGAADGDLKGQDLDDLQDGVIELFARPPQFRYDLTDLFPDVHVWSCCYFHYFGAFAFVNLDLSSGLKFSWQGDGLRGPNIAGPGSGIGATQAKIVAHPSSNLLLVCRNSSSATAANRLCRSVDGASLSSVTVPVSSTVRPLLWWTGSAFWGTFDGTTAHRSTDGLTWTAATTPTSLTGDEVSAAWGRVTIGPTSFDRLLLSKLDGRYYSDNGGMTWSPFINRVLQADSTAYLPGVGFVVAGANAGAPAAEIMAADGTWTTVTLNFRGIPAGMNLAALRHIQQFRGRLIGLVTQDAAFGDFTASIGGFLVSSIDGVNWDVIRYEALGGASAFDGHTRPVVAGRFGVFLLTGSAGRFGT